MVEKLTIVSLLTAVKECRLKAAEESILQYGIPKSTKKTTDYLVLQTALDKNRVNVAKLLINAGCRFKPNENEKDIGWTPLAWTVMRGNIEIAHLLLNKGAPSEAGNRSGLSVLHLAVRKKSLNMVRLLLCHMSIDLIDSSGKSVLETFFQVVCNQINVSQEEMTNNVEILEVLLAKGANLNFPNDPFGYTPMHYAVKSKQVGLINKMIQKTGRVNVRSRNGNTPLHVLISDYNFHAIVVLNIVRLLVRNGANVNITNNQGENLLHVVLVRCNSDEDRTFNLMEFLVEQGANINAQNLHNESACHLAAKKKYLRVLDLVLSRHLCQINLLDHENNTVLHRLLQNSRHLKPHNAFLFIVNQILALKPMLEDRNTEGNSPLDLVIQNMHTGLLRRFLTENVNINAVDDHGNTILHKLLYDLIDKIFVIKNGHIELIEILLSHGANVDLANNINVTPVQLALTLEIRKTKYCPPSFSVILILLNYTNDFDNITDERGRPILHIMSSLQWPFQESEEARAVKIVKVCLERGASVNLRDRSGVTPLCMAATNKQEHVVKVLLKHGADANFYIPNSEATILECLLRTNRLTKADVEIADALLSHGAVIDESPASEFSLLNYVIRPSRLEMCYKLISYIKNVDVVDSHQNTILHRLLTQHDIDDITENRVCKIATKLVLKGDLINRPNDQGLTPLHLAVKHKLQKVTKELLDRGADPVARDNFGNCALHFLDAFPFKNSLEFARSMVKLLNRFGYNVNTRNDNGTTPLLAAVRSRIDTWASALIENDADVNLSTLKELESPLHFAAENDSASICQMLIKHGADVNAKRLDGKTALHIAVTRNALNTIKILLENGADPDMMDINGRTAIWLANSSSVNILLNSGADINLADNADEIPVEFASGQVKIELTRHIQILQAANMFVSPANSRINMIRLPQYEEFAKEAEKMKEAKIDNQKSLADVLRMSRQKLATFKNNKDFQKLVNAADLDEQYPRYANLLRACYTRGSIRSDLLAQAKISFRDLIEMPLPDLCCDMIFSFLSNDALKLMATAARLKNTLQKRQRDDNDDEDVDAPRAKKARRLSV